MDLLALGEVAELLGEPESAILAACRLFPEHVPVVGSGRGRRFPSIALDVLRLITDATAAGAPATAINHLIQTHYAAARDLASELLDSPGRITAGDEDEPAQIDIDELVGRIQGVVEASILPVVQMLASEVGATKVAVEQVRAEFQDTARADDLDLLRVETRSLTASQHSPAGAADIPSELATIQAQLRPALHSLNEVKVAVEGLREEMAALRWQLDQREQLGLLIAEIAELRTQMAHLESTSHERAEGNHAPGESLDRDVTGTGSVEETQVPDGVIAASSAPSDDIEQPTTEQQLPAAAQLEPDSPSAIITEFASRTPRRMGRTLFADEG